MKRNRRLLTLVLMMVTVFAMSMNAHAAVKISKKNVTLIKGQTVNLKVTGTNKKVKWSSSKKVSEIADCHLS